MLSKSPLPALGFALAAAAVAVAALVVPALYLVSGALCAYAALRFHAANGRMALLIVPAAAVIGISLYLTDSAVAGISFALLSLLPGAAVYLLQIKKQGGFVAAAVAAAGAIAALYGAICMPGVLSGEGAFALVQRIMAETGALMREIFSGAMVGNAALSEVYESYFAALENGTLAADYTVPVICTVGCVIGLSALLFFRLFAKKHRAALGLLPQKPLSGWSIPRGYTFGLFMLLLASLALSLFGVDYAEAVSNTVTALVSFPLAVQGLALVDFFLQRRKKNLALRRVLIYAAICLLFSFAQSILVMIGCFEQLFRARERAAAAPPSGV